MNDRQPISYRYGVLLFLPVFCLMSACADGKSATKAPNEDLVRFEESTRQLRQLAQGGDASAQNELGLLYYEGKGVPQNHKRAKEWFDKAVEQGHSGAQVNLGTLYLRGEGAPQSGQMALFWFSRAAGQEDALAFAKLGMMYSQGRGVLQDFIQAHMWYNLSAAHGEGRSAEARDALAKQMTPAQIAEAQRLAREWRPSEEKSRKTVS
jgi:uncharacterized protein